MLIVAITSSSKLFKKVGLLNSQHTHHHDYALFVFIAYVVVLMIIVHVNYGCIMLLQHHSCHYIAMTFEQNVHPWYKIFVKTIWKCGTIDTRLAVIFVISVIITIIWFYISSSNSSSSSWSSSSLSSSL